MILVFIVRMKTVLIVKNVGFGLHSLDHKELSLVVSRRYVLNHGFSYIDMMIIVDKFFIVFAGKIPFFPKIVNRQVICL